MAKSTTKKAPAKKPAKKAAAKKPAKKAAAKKPAKKPVVKAVAQKDLTPKPKDFAAAFKQIMGAPRKRTAAELFGDTAPAKFEPLVLKQMVAAFHEDNARLPELNFGAIAAGLNPQAFNLVCALTAPAAKQLHEDLMTYLAVL